MSELEQVDWAALAILLPLFGAAVSFVAERHAARIGVPVAIVTRSATRGDAEATVRLHAPLGATLDALGAALGHGD